MILLLLPAALRADSFTFFYDRVGLFNHPIMMLLIIGGAVVLIAWLFESR